jgi:hypothetical protein
MRCEKIHNTFRIMVNQHEQIICIDQNMAPILEAIRFCLLRTHLYIRICFACLSFRVSESPPREWSWKNLALLERKPYIVML